MDRLLAIYSLHISMYSDPKELLNNRRVEHFPTKYFLCLIPTIKTLGIKQDIFETPQQSLNRSF